MEESIIRLVGLTKHFPHRGFFRVSTFVHAVDEVDLDIRRNETLGVVGESGCGKTTLGRLILLLMRATKGKILWNGTNITSLKGKELASFRKKTAIVFQDPFSSLDPKMLIVHIVGEPLEIHGIAYGRDRDDQVARMLEKVGLGKEFVYRYPHELSGGKGKEWQLLGPWCGTRVYDLG